MLLTDDNIIIQAPDFIRRNIDVYEGSRYRERIARFLDSSFEPIDISVYQFKLDIRLDYDSDILLECTVENGRLLRNESLSHLVLNLTKEDVASLGVGRYYFDLRVVRNQYANLWYPIKGTFNLLPSITK